MIKKNFQINNNTINTANYYLFHGLNEGMKEEKIYELLSREKKENIYKYEEKNIIDNQDDIINQIKNKSLFQEKKIFLIHRATDKIFKFIDNILTLNITDVYFILISDLLDKKSKLRNLFEKNNNTISVAFYEDTNENLNNIANKILEQNKIQISQADLNLITRKCNGDRGVLKNELDKVVSYAAYNKKITTENLVKLINLIENYSIQELIDTCLIKNETKTLRIINENNFNNEDCIIITRVFLNKLKRILKLSIEYEKNNNLEKTITLAKPPIFWKDKEIVKNQLLKWKSNNIKELIYKLNEIELEIKKHLNSAVNLVIDFIIEQSISKINN